MILILINSFLSFGSTGHIVVDIAKEYKKNEYGFKLHMTV